MNNERFGNNILRNLELSYQVVGYIINQYLYRNIFTSNTQNLETIPSETIPSHDKIYRLISKENINKVKKSYYINELIVENNEKLNEINEKLKKNKSESSEDLLKKYFEDTKKKLYAEKEKLEKVCENLKNIIEKDKDKLKILDYGKPKNYDIINTFNDFIENNDRGSYMELWKELLSDKEIIKDDCNLTMIKYVKDLNKLDGNDFKNDFKNNFENNYNFLNKLMIWLIIFTKLQCILTQMKC